MINKSELKFFLITLLIIGTLGLLIIQALGGFEGDKGFALLPLVLFGIPWNFLLSSLMPSFGNFGDLIIMILTVYINIFIIWFLIKKLHKKEKYEETTILNNNRSSFNLNNPGYGISYSKKIFDFFVGYILSYALFYILTFYFKTEYFHFLSYISNGFSGILGMFISRIFFSIIVFFITKKRRYIFYGTLLRIFFPFF